ncbi:MAG: hypothetical protein HUJ30_07180 [Gammaproteobacteria bacterium]|nr:hypothetical protein [Gammaproteobacteria bacterium]
MQQYFQTAAGVAPQIVTICMYCEKIRDNGSNSWSASEKVKEGVLLSHGMCPNCQTAVYKELEILGSA